MLTSFIVGVRQLALLALKLVRVESVEHESVDAVGGLEVVLAVRAVAVHLQPLFDTFATEEGLAPGLAALLWLLDSL